MILWLAAGELAAGPTAPLPDLHTHGEHIDESEGAHAWDNVEPTTDIWLIPRVDPNAGKALVERGETRLAPTAMSIPQKV